MGQLITACNFCSSLSCYNLQYVILNCYLKYLNSYDWHPLISSLLQLARGAQPQPCLETKHLLLAPRTQLLWLHFIISSWASSYDCWHCHGGRWSHYCDIMPSIISVSIANSVRSIRQSIVWWLSDHKIDQSILTELADHHLPSLTQVLIAFKTFQTNCEAGQ